MVVDGAGGARRLCAGAWVQARDREKLEQLCRHAARPAVAESRLVELADGAFKTPTLRNDGLRPRLFHNGQGPALGDPRS